MGEGDQGRRAGSGEVSACLPVVGAFAFWPHGGSDRTRGPRVAARQAKISKTTPCKESNPLQTKGKKKRNKGASLGCFRRKKDFDPSGKSPAHLHHRANCRPAVALTVGLSA